MIILYFSETSSWNPINFQDLNGHLKVMMGLFVGVMHGHSLVDFSEFQWPFFSL